MRVLPTCFLACILVLAFAVSAVAQTSITGHTADYELAPGPVLGSTTNSTTRAGASNAASNPGLRNVVYIFAVPAAPGGQVVTSAKLSFTFASKSGTPSFNADLWGIGFQAGTTPIIKALSANTNTDGVKVQDNIHGTGHTIEVIDPGGAAQPKRFYRIVVQ